MRRFPFVFIDAERFLLPAIDLPVQLAELVAGNQLRAALPFFAIACISAMRSFASPA